MAGRSEISDVIKRAAIASYTPKKGERVVRLVAEGFSQREIYEREGICRSTLQRWLQNHPDFYDKFSRAFNASLEMRFYDLVDRAGDSSGDWIERENAAGKIEKVFNHNHVARDRLELDTLKFALSKLVSHKYGDQPAQAVDVSIAVTVSQEERRKRAIEAIDAAFVEHKPEPLPLPSPTPAPEKFEEIPREFVADAAPEVDPDVTRLPTRYRPPRIIGDGGWSG